MKTDRRSARPWFVLAALFTGLFALNIALRMLHVKLGIALWRVGDVGEFLLVLIAMAFFVAGLLLIEEKPPAALLSPTHNDSEGGAA